MKLIYCLRCGALITQQPSVKGGMGLLCPSCAASPKGQVKLRRRDSGQIPASKLRKAIEQGGKDRIP